MKCRNNSKYKLNLMNNKNLFYRYKNQKKKYIKYYKSQMIINKIAKKCKKL